MNKDKKVGAEHRNQRQNNHTKHSANVMENQRIRCKIYSADKQQVNDNLAVHVKKLMKDWAFPAQWTTNCGPLSLKSI